MTKCDECSSFYLKWIVDDSIVEILDCCSSHNVDQDILEGRTDVVINGSHDGEGTNDGAAGDTCTLGETQKHQRCAFVRGIINKLLVFTCSMSLSSKSPVVRRFLIFYWDGVLKEKHLENSTKPLPSEACQALHILLLISNKNVNRLSVGWTLLAHACLL